MSVGQFQEVAIKKVTNCLRGMEGDIRYVRERKIDDFGRTRMQDLYVECGPGFSKHISVEIKSSAQDINSKYGWNFTEEYNFLIYPKEPKAYTDNTMVIGITMQKAENELHKRGFDDVGILMIDEFGELICRRPSISRKTGEEMRIEESKQEPRSVTLLRAAHALLHKQYHAGIVLNLLEETVFYDEAECDGNCLLNDIEYYFDEIGVEIPEKERVNP